MTNKRLRTKRTAPAKGPDAIVLLRSDHRAVALLLDQLKNTRSTTRKKTIVRQICLALTVHAQLEEEIFYPAVSAALKDRELLRKALLEQATLKTLIAEVQEIEPTSEDYGAQVKRVLDYLRQHVDEQNEIFPKTRSSGINMGMLGAQLASRKQELLTASGDFGGWD